MKSTLFVITALLFSESVSAISCTELEKIANDNRAEYPVYIYENGGPAPTQYSPYQSIVKGSKGFKTYFHTAPSTQCKIKNLFMIPHDLVNVNYDFNYRNQHWLHVTYWNKGNDTSGWILAKDLSSPKRAGTKD
ncbi:MAG: hypothetical protein RR598_11335 [Anaerorhabdus sp.]